MSALWAARFYVLAPQDMIGWVRAPRDADRVGPGHDCQPRPKFSVVVCPRAGPATTLRVTRLSKPASVRMVSQQRLSLLLGGGGVGKTATLSAIVAMARESGRTVHQIALSGHAALRMREATSYPARTIVGWLGRIEREEMKLEGRNLIIIDEASMLDLATFYVILRALTPSCRLLLVGDPAQLPPIGFGLTLHVLANDDPSPKVELTEVMRQAAESGIPGPARAVRDGWLPAFDRLDAIRGTGVLFVEVVDTILSLSSAMGGPTQVQVIGSVKGSTDRSDGAIRVINAAFHQAAKEDSPVLFERFSPGEPVISHARGQTLARP
jgi:exodeoxyribonuclease V alpha subunit